MTDEKIEKTLEICSNINVKCAECPAIQECKAHSYDNTFLMGDILKYINRLKTENAGLTGALEATKTDNDNLTRTLEECNEELKQIRKETAKEIYTKLLQVQYKFNLPETVKINVFDGALLDITLEEMRADLLNQFNEIFKKYDVEVDE